MPMCPMKGATQVSNGMGLHTMQWGNRCFCTSMAEEGGSTMTGDSDDGDDDEGKGDGLLSKVIRS